MELLHPKSRAKMRNKTVFILFLIVLAVVAAAENVQQGKNLGKRNMQEKNYGKFSKKFRNTKRKKSKQNKRKLKNLRKKNSQKQRIDRYLQLCD